MGGWTYSKRTKNKDTGVKYRSAYESYIATLLPEGTEYETQTYEWEEKQLHCKCKDCGSSDVVKVKTYTPDFILPNGVILEAKGIFTAANRKKHKWFAKERPDLNIKMVFMMDNKINKTSEVRYSSWCKSNNVEYDVVPSKGGNFKMGFLEE